MLALLIAALSEPRAGAGGSFSASWIRTMSWVTASHFRSSMVHVQPA